MINNTRRLTLTVGLVLMGLCALFPPRRYSGNVIMVNDSTVAPRIFLWSPHLHLGGEMDAPKLMAEILVLFAVTGIVLVWARDQDATQKST